MWCIRNIRETMNAPDSHPQQQQHDDPEQVCPIERVRGREKEEKITNGLMRIINVFHGFILVISFNCQLIHFLVVISLIIKSKN